MSELVIACAIGVLVGSGAWLLLRPRTFQVAVRLAMNADAVNLFISAMGRLRVGAAAVIEAGKAADPAAFADPLPEALVLTAIVLGFATTALLLVLFVRAGGLRGTR